MRVQSGSEKDYLSKRRLRSADCPMEMSLAFLSRQKTKVGQYLARRRLVQQVLEALHGWALQASAGHDKIVLLPLQRKKPQPGGACHVLDGQAPIGALLLDRGGYGIVRPRLHDVARRPGSLQELVNQDARTTS